MAISNKLVLVGGVGGCGEGKWREGQTQGRRNRKRMRKHALSKEAATEVCASGQNKRQRPLARQVLNSTGKEKKRL